jgi:hypothetical protein
VNPQTQDSLTLVKGPDRLWILKADSIKWLSLGDFNHDVQNLTQKCN